MNSRFKLILYIICVVTISSCKDKCTSGHGGGLNFKLKTTHHSKYVKGCTVRIRFDTQDFPGTSDSYYDIVHKIPDTDSTATITGLKCGDYFIYATGYDSTLNVAVEGKLPYSTSDEDGLKEIIIPVAEPGPH